MPSHYERICRDNIKEYGEGTKHLSFIERLHPDRTHFILELLQNAEDKRAKLVRFQLEPDRLLVWHNGDPFEPWDVIGVCGIAASTKKTDLTKIGKFGIGFKSVCTFTDRPEVHCGDEHFAIENYTRPHGISPEIIPQPWTTLFVLPFNRVDVPADVARNEIAQGLAKLKPTAMLFLRHICEIEWSAPGVPSKRYVRHESVQGPARRVSLTNHIRGIGFPSGTWLVFEAPVTTDVPSNDLRVEAAFSVVSEKGEDRIAAVDDATLSVFFPTATRTRLGFVIQGPYKTTPARDNVPPDDAENRKRVAETASLVVSALGHLRDMKLLTVAALQTLPIRQSDFPADGMFRPIFDSVVDALLTQPLIPTDSGEFVGAAQAKIASSGEIKKLFPTGPPITAEPTQWVSGEITADLTRDLYKYLREVLQIEEVTPESIVRQLDQRFLEEKPDDWLTRFYGFLAGRKALWQKPQWTGETPAPARSVPIIRLEDGTHVLPFRKDGSPAAYLTVSFGGGDIPAVRQEIVAHEPSREFLKNLGIPDFDASAKLRETVLPKYRVSPAVVSKEQNLDDLRCIARVLSETKNDEKLRALLIDVKNTPLVNASNTSPTRQAGYVKPGQVYFGSDDLSLYFAGDPGTWFLAEYPDDLTEVFQRLGVSEKEREVGPVRLRDGGYVSLDPCRRDNVSYYRRGVQGFDPDLDIDGLRRAVENPNPERSRYIWNRIALPRARDLRGSVEEATRCTFRNATPKPRVSKMGDTLMNFAWLPSGDQFVKPADLRLEDLPDGFDRDETLSKQLGMKVDEVAKLLQKHDIPAEAFAIAKQIVGDPELYRRFLTLGDAKTAKPEFPTRPTADPKRRAEHVARDAETSLLKEYEERRRSVRISEPALEPAPWLLELYKNPSGQMICQICEQEMPFKKHDGEYYFEAVEALNTLPREQHQNHLALCPVCAAKYKEFVKRDEDALQRCQDLIVAAEIAAVPLQLGGEEATLRFVEAHLLDLKTLLGGNNP